MPPRQQWTRWQLLVAFALYCRLPFGRLHRGNPEIIRFSNAIGRSPSALAMKLTNIASLDPLITSSGRVGLRNASPADREMWQEMATDSASFAVECQSALVEAATRMTQESQPEEAHPVDFIGDERVVQTTARVGQSFFRTAVLSAYEGRCCITGLSLPSLLVASHIVPWRLDKRNRLNPRNGLALSALHDRAFDSGLIAISDNLTVLVAKNHASKDDSFFRSAIEEYEGQPIRLPRKFGIEPEFLKFHRNHVFQG